jgi:sarcosine oxidase, subunit gamma
MIRKGCGCMSDASTRSEPVPTAPFLADAVTISLAPPMARYSLRARQGQALETLIGVKVPMKIGATEGSIACLGPDEWLMRAEAGTLIPNGAGLAVSVTDVSERSICLIVEGPKAAQLIMAGCPQDLYAFHVGKASRTIFETVEIILIRETEERFHIEVWRSFASWLWTALTTGASH